MVEPKPKPSEAAPPVDTKPTVCERWLGAIPLFMCFLLLALLVPVASRFEETYREMEFGYLPVLTVRVLGTARTIRALPWLFTAGMFALAWLYFTFLCAERKRIVVSALVFALLLVLGVAAFIWGLESPFSYVPQRTD